MTMVCCDEAAPFGDACEFCEAGAHEQCTRPVEVERESRLSPQPAPVEDNDGEVRPVSPVAAVVRTDPDGVWAAFGGGDENVLIFRSELACLRYVVTHSGATAKYLTYEENE